MFISVLFAFAALRNNQLKQSAEKPAENQLKKSAKNSLDDA
jgi:hypothetical protein